MSHTPLVTIFGGSGFVGRYIAQRMAQAGWRVRVAVRRPNEAMHVLPYGEVGQVALVQANVRDTASCRAAIAGADAVVNCVGIIAETSRQKFNDVNCEAAARVARLAAEAGVSQFVHLSALAADAGSESEYAVSKAKGEAAVLRHFPKATILRPSIIFGTEDSFFNMFGTMSRYFPVLPIVGAESKMQPVYVDDVAAAAEAAILGNAPGVYELGGPDVETMRALMQRLMRVVRRDRFIVNIPFGLARINAFFIEIWHKVSLGIVPLVLTRDQVKLLKVDNVVRDGAQGLADLGVHPTGMDAVLDSYLYRFRPQGQYTDLTTSAKNLRG
ncbi:MAG TPA: complex I NDUFA9 subunit family protein [Rhodobacteraceae bacterium]|nr:complex I NDUFA9 subunit family protein [Paracoccaceae bacterium]